MYEILSKISYRRKATAKNIFDAVALDDTCIKIVFYMFKKQLIHERGLLKPTSFIALSYWR